MFEAFIQRVPISQFLKNEDLKIKSQNATTSASSSHFSDQTNVRKILSQILEEKHLSSEVANETRNHLPSPIKQKQSFHLISNSSIQKKQSPTPEMQPKNMVPIIQRMAYLQNMQILTNLKQQKQQLQQPLQMQSSLIYDSELIKNKFRKASQSDIHKQIFDEEDTDNDSTIHSQQQAQQDKKDMEEEFPKKEETQQKEDKDNKKFTFSKQKIKRQKFRNKKPNVCGHVDREHYAKNMCKNCYHKNGRTKRPWLCGHDKLYAHGLCQNCYINKYNQDKNIKKHQVHNKQ